MAIPLFIALFFFPSLLLSFFGEEFTDGKVALQILAVGMFVNALFGSVGNYLMMSGHEKLLAKILLAAILISIMLMLLLVPNYGIVGAAWSVSITMIIWNCAAYFSSNIMLGKYHEVTQSNAHIL